MTDASCDPAHGDLAHGGPANLAGPALVDALPLDALARRTAGQFRDRFGRDPQWIAAAPGRVNLIGEHTDYNDGFVLPMAIERYVVMAAASANPGGSLPAVRVHSSSLDDEAAFSPDTAARELPPWARYICGVMAGCRQRGMDWGPLDIEVASTVPLGGGLSSSAALEVATATLLEAITGAQLDPVKKALLCQRAEHEYAGVPCGIMDQFTSVMGRRDHLLLLDCRSREVRLVPLDDPGVAVLIVNSNVKHELTGGEYAERRKQCEQAAQRMGVASLRDSTFPMLNALGGSLDAVLRRRARHVIGEIERTTAAAERIAAGDWREVGRLMYASHASLRDDYEVSCAELDLLVELAHRHGEDGSVIGSRMTGGGFGGCTVSLVQKDQVGALAARIREDYCRETGIAPTLFTTRPAAGARIVSAGG